MACVLPCQHGGAHVIARQSDTACPLRPAAQAAGDRVVYACRMTRPVLAVTVVSCAPSRTFRPRDSGRR